MSEKELREAAERALAEGLTTIWSSEWTHGSPQDQLKQALSQPPDLVVVLRLLDKMQNKAMEAFNSGTARNGFAIYDSLLHVTEYITDEIGVRLTEDGWVWVEENE